VGKALNQTDSPGEDPEDTNGLSLVSSVPESSGMDPTKANVRGRGGGPRTIDGKKSSSRNATSHAITSPSPVAAGQSQEEFDAFHAGFRVDWDPVGLYEDEMVLDLATLMWRLRRITKAEVAYIDMKYQAIDDPDPVVEVSSRWSSADRYFEKWGVDLEDALEFLDSLLDADDNAEVDFEGFMDLNGFTVWLEPRDAPVDEVQVEFEEGDVLRRKAVMTYLIARSRQAKVSYVEYLDTLEDTAKEVLAHRRSKARSVRLRRQHRELDALLPSPAQLETITKYEAHLRRSIAKTTTQLEIAQRQRAGDRPPPPQRIEVTMDVDRGD
jgi:hypothetical protein